jgi:hypothetical protein
VAKALVVRKRRDGSTTIEGDPPVEHGFSARWIARQIQEGLVTVTIAVNTSDGPVAYELTGFETVEGAVEDDGSPRPNFTGWLARRVEGG